MNDKLSQLSRNESALPKAHEYSGVLQHGTVEEHGTWVRAVDYDALRSLARRHFSTAQIAATVGACARSESGERHWLAERIAWLKREIAAGGDYEHLNTRRKEAIHIADKLGVKWEE